jgi:DNA replication protein DnaC
LLHGFTGAGKSTSAAYNAKQALFRGFTVKWYQLAALLDEWRLARCSDNPLDVPYLYRRIESYDLVILDECDKPVSTESTREMMFRLLEDVANGTSHCRLWMLGNWYRGAIEDIFGNGAAARRRFDESFQCAEITKDGKIKKIRLYKGGI